MPFGRKSAGPAGLRFFNMDLHHAVIADVKDVLRRLYGSKVLITSYSLNLLDGQAMGFPAPTKTSVEVAALDSTFGGPPLINHVSW